MHCVGSALLKSCLIKRRSWPENLGDQVAAESGLFKRQARVTVPELLNEGCRLSSLSDLLYNELFCVITATPVVGGIERMTCCCFLEMAGSSITRVVSSCTAARSSELDRLAYK